MIPPYEHEPPAAVSSAAKLLYVSFGIGVVRPVLEWELMTQRATPDFIFIVLAVTIGLGLWLASMIRQGRNWARILFLVFFLSGLPFTCGPLLQTMEYSPLSAMLGVVQIALQGLAVVLLFGREASPWFHGAAERDAITSAEMKKCPFCAELTRREAIKCRYCGSDLRAA